MARDAGLDPSFLSKLILGQRNPPADEKRLAALAGALGMDATQLCFLAGRIPEKLKPIFQEPSFLAEVSRYLPSAKANPKEQTAKPPDFSRKRLPPLGKPSGHQVSSTLTEDLL